MFKFGQIKDNVFLQVKMMGNSDNSKYFENFWINHLAQSILG